MNADSYIDSAKPARNANPELASAESAQNNADSDVVVKKPTGNAGSMISPFDIRMRISRTEGNNCYQLILCDPPTDEEKASFLHR